MYTLGINASPSGAAACLVQDGTVLAAQEERSTPDGCAGGLPEQSISFCLGRAGLALAQLDHVAIAGTPSHVPCKSAPPALRSLLQAELSETPYLRHFVPRQEAREALAYLSSPAGRTAVMVLNSHASDPGACFGVHEDGRYRRIGVIDAPHSIGRLHDDVSLHLGFSATTGDGRLAALAPCGRPGFVPVLREMLSCPGPGQLRLTRMDLSEVLGPPRTPGQPLEQRHMDIAHSLQRVIEDAVLELAHWLHGVTHASRLCLAGDLALNCLLNTALRARACFDDVGVAPAPGERGTALGAALLVDARYGPAGVLRAAPEHLFLGPEFSDAEIEEMLVHSKLAYRQCDDIARDTAALLAQDKIVGWFHGAAEFGPRALGARSILAAPFDTAVQERLLALKGRDGVRTVGVMTPHESAADWFVDGSDSPFMSFVDQVRPAVVHRIAGACHVDGSVRLQTLSRDQHQRCADLLDAFGRLTGIPVILNTSFNLCGEAAVATPREALALFCSTSLDALAIGPFLLEKSWLTAWQGTAA